MRDVCFSCDDNGAKFLCVTVWSLLKHYRGEEPLRINVFEGFGGHSAESKAKLAEVVESFNEEAIAKPGRDGVPPPSAAGDGTPALPFPRGLAIGSEVKARGAIERSEIAEGLREQRNDFCSLRYIDVEKAIEPYADLIMNRERSRWNVFTWTPVFTPMLLDDATGNVAHFDIDMLFNDDVSKILDIDLGDNLIAAVAEYGKGDPVITEAVWGKGILPPEAERYFNTGTIVFNVKKCREEKTWEKILAWYREHYDVADRIEQDAWNALYWRRTKLLPLRWNFHDRLIRGYARRDLRARYWQGNSPVDCLEAALNPAILHFWGPKKPWKVSHRPYRKLYHEAMRAVGQTPPGESWCARWHDAKTARALEKCRFSQLVIVGKALPRRPLKAVWRKLRLPFEWLGIALGVLVLSNLPHGWLLAVCDWISAVLYRLDGHGRRLALENLRIARGLRPWGGKPVRFDPDKAPYDPSPAEEKIVRRSYRNMARTVGHVFWTLRAARRRVGEVGEMSSECKAFLAANRPAVTVSAHVGCWEILSQLAFLEGHEMMSVAKDIGTPAMTRLLMRARRSIGQEIVPADGAFKALMGGIRGGKSLGLLVDQCVCPADGGIWVRFFGRPIPVSAAPAFFAAKAKAPIVVAWSRPLKDGRYRCEYVDRISAEEARDVWATTQRCARDLERVIRRHPSCWVMNYDFFRYGIGRKDAEVLAEREGRVAG